jgi:hypothetical protein
MVYFPDTVTRIVERNTLGSSLLDKTAGLFACALGSLLLAPLTFAPLSSGLGSVVHAGVPRQRTAEWRSGADQVFTGPAVLGQAARAAAVGHGVSSVLRRGPQQLQFRPMAAGDNGSPARRC